MTPVFGPEGPRLRELAVQALSSVEHGYDLLAPKFDHTPFRTPESVLDAVADVLARLGACARVGGDYATDSGGAEDVPICQTANAVWWTADMDIDCDGGRGAACLSDPSYLPDTSAVDSSGNPLG